MKNPDPVVRPGDVWEVPHEGLVEGPTYLFVFFIGPMKGTRTLYARCFQIDRNADGTWEEPTLQLGNFRVEDGYFSLPGARKMTLEEFDWLELLES